MEQIGTGLIVLLVIFNWMAWRSNVEANLSWERMRRDLFGNYMSSIPWKGEAIKAFYSQRLLEHLVPAKGWDDGYAHSVIGGRVNR